MGKLSKRQRKFAPKAGMFYSTPRGKSVSIYAQKLECSIQHQGGNQFRFMVPNVETAAYGKSFF